MPEEVAPGVYVEETSFRARTIEGVPTSTLGMAGETQYGPVACAGTMGRQVCGGPVLVTSVSDYEHVFGGFTTRGRPCRLALAARAFFENGGRRLYVQRVFVPTAAGPGAAPEGDFALLDLPEGPRGASVRWQGRWPGTAGSRIRVLTRLRRSANLQEGTRLRDLRPGAAVETVPLVAGQPPQLPEDAVPAALHVVTEVDGVLCLRDGAGAVTTPLPDHAAFHITLDVEVHFGDRLDVYRGLELGAEHPRHVTKVLNDTEPDEANGLVWLTVTQPVPVEPGLDSSSVELLAALLSPGPQGAQLLGGSDGGELTPSALAGRPADPDSSIPATGLAALGEVDEVAIVAMPDCTYAQDEDHVVEAVHALIAHCERDRHRFAIIDPPGNMTSAELRAFRSRFDSSYAALYHPWLHVTDPTPPTGPPPPPTAVPPSGAVAGIFARSDSEHGVHKAPANVVHGITDLVQGLSTAEQQELNPEGINLLRFIPGRGNVVWGARTVSSDPEWKYVNVRRLVIYLEHSIEKSTQWAVFEPNDERLWGAIRRSIEDFLTSTWRAGALAGAKPEEAFFVRCDRTTMSQDDLDNARLVALAGVAPIRPAEFVLLHLVQRTAGVPGGGGGTLAPPGA